MTEIEDGDTLNVNNVRIRLSMINTPETAEPGYNEATAAAESECAVGSEALVDEDDGKKGGSFGRLIGAVYCNGNNVSLNEILLDEGKDWIASSGC